LGKKKSQEATNKVICLRFPDYRGDYNSGPVLQLGSCKTEQVIWDVLDFGPRRPEFSHQTTWLTVRGICQACWTSRGPGLMALDNLLFSFAVHIQ